MTFLGCVPLDPIEGKISGTIQNDLLSCVQRNELLNCSL